MDNITIKDKIVFNHPGDEKRYTQYNGYEAVVVKYNADNGDYNYFLMFYNKKIQEIQMKDGGGLYMKPQWITKIGIDEEKYNEYLELEIQKEEARKYTWGKCEKCNGPLDMYYGTWCPSCEKPEVRTVKTLNFFTMTKYLDVHGRLGIKDRLWDWLCSHEDIRNDSTIDFYLESKDIDDDNISDELIADIQAIKDTWDIKEDMIKIEISW